MFARGVCISNVHGSDNELQSIDDVHTDNYYKCFLYKPYLDFVKKIENDDHEDSETHRAIYQASMNRLLRFNCDLRTFYLISNFVIYEALEHHTKTVFKSKSNDEFPHLNENAIITLLNYELNDFIIEKNTAKNELTAIFFKTYAYTECLPIQADKRIDCTLSNYIKFGETTISYDGENVKYCHALRLQFSPVEDIILYCFIVQFLIGNGIMRVLCVWGKRYFSNTAIYYHLRNVYLKLGTRKDYKGATKLRKYEIERNAFFSLISSDDNKFVHKPDGFSLDEARNYLLAFILYLVQRKQNISQNEEAKKETTNQINLFVHKIARQFIKDGFDQIGLNIHKVSQANYDYLETMMDCITSVSKWQHQAIKARLREKMEGKQPCNDWQQNVLKEGDQQNIPFSNIINEVSVFSNTDKTTKTFNTNLSEHLEPDSSVNHLMQLNKNFGVINGFDKLDFSIKESIKEATTNILISKECNQLSNKVICNNPESGQITSLIDNFSQTTNNKLITDAKNGSIQSSNQSSQLNQLHQVHYGNEVNQTAGESHPILWHCLQTTSPDISKSKNATKIPRRAIRRSKQEIQINRKTRNENTVYTNSTNTRKRNFNSLQHGQDHHHNLSTLKSNQNPSNQNNLSYLECQPNQNNNYYNSLNSSHQSNYPDITPLNALQKQFPNTTQNVSYQNDYLNCIKPSIKPGNQIANSSPSNQNYYSNIIHSSTSRLSSSLINSNASVQGSTSNMYQNAAIQPITNIQQNTNTQQNINTNTINQPSLNQNFNQHFNQNVNQSMNQNMNQHLNQTMHQNQHINTSQGISLNYSTNQNFNQNVIHNNNINTTVTTPPTSLQIHPNFNQNTLHNSVTTSPNNLQLHPNFNQNNIHTAVITPPNNQQIHFNFSQDNIHTSLTTNIQQIHQNFNQHVTHNNNHNSVTTPPNFNFNPSLNDMPVLNKEVDTPQFNSPTNLKFSSHNNYNEQSGYEHYIQSSIPTPPRNNEHQPTSAIYPEIPYYTPTSHYFNQQLTHPIPPPTTYNNPPTNDNDVLRQHINHIQPTYHTYHPSHIENPNYQYSQPPSEPYYSNYPQTKLHLTHTPAKSNPYNCHSTTNNSPTIKEPFNKIQIINKLHHHTT
uniref:DUF4806 domain-containing protein n=1 Tax=Rhabditophanes sp. KR3021 TaxID=114890 RepID=A0AC35TZQ5_9BILA